MAEAFRLKQQSLSKAVSVVVFLPAILVLSALTLLSWSIPVQAVIHHDLRVEIEPSSGMIEVQDTITLTSEHAAKGAEVSFVLNAKLAPHFDGIEVQKMPVESGHDVALYNNFKVRLPVGRRNFTMHYRGQISAFYHRFRQDSRQANGATGNLIDSVYLDSENVWYPHFEHETVSFSLDVNLPSGWTAVSQGSRLYRTEQNGRVTVRWQELRPQDTIYLIAGRHLEYRRASAQIEMLVFLLSEDRTLAERYLDATAEYLDLYSRLIGPYPYDKFAMVENTRQTGFGMPSFTLLGSRVIRLPFILHSSYPHEILHNWWGNSVYVDYSKGNWSEGLTAYLADHLLQEQQGRGKDYRRAALQKYANRVNEQRDFPLNEFRMRHSEASQAVGYSKALMFFHMLRHKLGDDAFIEGLRRFYRDYRFRHASYADLQKSFEAISQTDLSPMFSQWVERTGAPSLNIRDINVSHRQDEFILEAVLEQTQTESAYRVEVPLLVELGSQQPPLETSVMMNAKLAKIQLRLPTRPLIFLVDPQFDVFRRLDRRELPPSLDLFFGSNKKMLVLPHNITSPLGEAYTKLARHWVSLDPDIEIRYDDVLAELPTDYSVWLLGWENRLRDQIDSALRPLEIDLQNPVLRLEGRDFRRDAHSLVLSGSSPANPQQAIVWLGTNNAAAVSGLARKLPHYGKYSFLVFSGDEPSIVAKGQWPVLNSPLRIDLNPTATVTEYLKLPKRPPLARFATDEATDQ